jgi:hypothetical protein
MLFSIAHGEESPLSGLKKDTISFFSPVSGVITGFEGDSVRIKIDSEVTVLPGMRLKVIREGAPFVHPVTKELLGKFESITGTVEITKVRDGSHIGVVVDGEADKGDKVRISETKIKMMFCQDNNIDWYLADEFYRKLKDSGRIEMIDTALETGDEEKVLVEAKKLGAEVAVLFTGKQTEKDTLVRQRLFWVSDGSKFFDREVKIDAAFAKDLKFGDEYFMPQGSEAVFVYDLSSDVRLIARGDFDGNGDQEIVLSTGTDLTIYKPVVDLKQLWEIKVPAKAEHIWLDTIDLNDNGKDELVVTTMGSGKVISDSDEMVSVTEGTKVVSFIYELEDYAFNELWRGEYFLRNVDGSLILQSYSDVDGFSGDIFLLDWNGNYKIGERIELPQRINIYDFTYIKGPASRQFVFAYDDKGYLNLFDENGVRTWRSKSSTGGFVKVFKKKSPVAHLEGDKWAVKDRLISRYREVFVVERVPLAEVVRGVGFKSSRIKSYWWNGFSMEERVLIDDIGGSVNDFVLVEDQVLVLTNPFLGIKFKNILKGENPLGSLLHMYSIKGG